MKTLAELIDECVKLSENGDFHLEHLNNEWSASVCWTDDSAQVWFTGKTAKSAVEKLVKRLREGV